MILFNEKDFCAVFKDSPPYLDLRWGSAVCFPIESPGQRERTLKTSVGDNDCKGEEEVSPEVAGMELRSWDRGASVRNFLISTEILLYFGCTTGLVRS